MTREPLSNAEHVEGFTSLQVSEMTGATLRQLQWWDEQCVVKPLHGIRWHQRMYGASQVWVIGRMVLLRKAGVSLQNLRKAAGIKTWKSIVVSKQPAVVVGDTLVVFQGRAK